MGIKMMNYILLLSQICILVSGLYVKKLKSETPCDKSSWNQWTSTLDCFWQDTNIQWWYNGHIAHEHGKAEWEDWNSIQSRRFESQYDQFYMAYYYENQHQKVCLPGGDILSISKVRADTMVTNCSQP